MTLEEYEKAHAMELSLLPLAIAAHAKQYNRHSKRALKRVCEAVWYQVVLPSPDEALIERFHKEGVYSARGLIKWAVKQAKELRKMSTDA